MHNFWSIVPPLVAILLAMATRRIYSSLLLGIAVGALIVAGGNPLAATGVLLEGLLWPALVEENHLRVFAFTLLMGSMVGVIRSSGGMEGAVAVLSRWATSRPRTGLLTWLLGMVIFFDDYANTLLLGTSMRPLADRQRMSREKLAYIVDSTAAPVAGLALVSTWIAGEIGYIAEGLKGLEFAGAGADAFNLFVASIPYRFYVIWALLLVPATLLLRRDFGPMAAAELRAQQQGVPVEEEFTEMPAAERHWSFAAVPIAVVLVVTTALLWFTGVQSLEGETPQSLMNVFGAANSYLALAYGSLAGLLAAVAMAGAVKEIPPAAVRQAVLEGAVLMLPALGILALAWALSALTGPDMLGTGVYLGSLIEGNLAPPWLPSLVFVMAAVVAFCTGTSWGTMGILMPLAISATHTALAVEGPVAVYDPIFIGTIAGVLSGAIFGDHCSPISDTTVLSSQASGCDHMAHVTTQLPYALLVAAVAILLGTIPIGLGVSVWVMLPAGLIVLVVILRLAGRSVA